ncbi:MAG: hypothetical protein ACLPYZ_10595 [Limisphaerales bacterium]
MPMAVLLWVWFFAHLNCAGRTLPALYPLHAADGEVALDEDLVPLR